MPRPISARIDTGAIRDNLAVARRHAPDSRLMVAAKADAYGHGLRAAFPGLMAADGIAVLDLHEAQTLRDLDWRGPILLIEGTFEPRDYEICSRLHLWPVIHCTEQIDALAAHKAREGLRVFLKMNSGMNRLGFAPQALGSAWARLDALTQVDEISLMTHLACADAAGGLAQGVGSALTLFESFTAHLPGERTVANSAATLRADAAASGGVGAAVQADWMRAGVLAYGASPSHPHETATGWGLRPAMTLFSQIIAVQDVAPGGRVGYGGTFEHSGSGPLRVGIVACGYADGYPRHAPTGTPVLVDGVRTRTLGRVSMDMLAVDLTPAPQAGYGSRVTLWGVDGAQVLSIDDVAASAGTIGYELMCALAPRVPRTVV
ncbi:alanine racemase [Amphibiibacter pelophylacis]|uniref:Alanine racemase n=1 Tax=Amphibiibacter pelophylacis TaxID=1799477 RepID=A0ACC6P4Q5_9BURK